MIYLRLFHHLLRRFINFYPYRKNYAQRRGKGISTLTRLEHIHMYILPCPSRFFCVKIDSKVLKPF